MGVRPLVLSKAIQTHTMLNGHMLISAWGVSCVPSKQRGEADYLADFTQRQGHWPRCCQLAASCILCHGVKGSLSGNVEIWYM